MLCFIGKAFHPEHYGVPPRCRHAYLFARVLVDVISHARLYPGCNPLEAIFPLQRSIDVLGTKQITDSRLNDKIYSGVIADMVCGTGVGCWAVDPQISITHCAAEELSPIVCIPKLSGRCWRCYQVSVC